MIGILPRDTVNPKVGREVVDPTGRHVTILSYDPSTRTVKVRLGGSYGATVEYPVSALRNVE